MPKPFPVELLKPLPGHIVGSKDDASIEIPLAPFKLGDLVVETALRLDGIHLPSLERQTLAGRRFTFPRNPEPGYIDGSIYIEHAHHPFEVEAINFGGATEGALATHIVGMLMLEFEGLECRDGGNEEFSNANLELETIVSFGKPV